MSALFRKYCHLMGELKRYPDRTDEIRQSMAHLEAVIRLFRPDADLSKLRPIKPRKDTRWHKVGFGIRNVLDILKQADRPLSTREIVLEVMQRAGLPTDDKKSVAAVCCSIHMSILRREGRGIVRYSGVPVRWVFG
jgi:hypothetical protein